MSKSTIKGEEDDGDIDHTPEEKMCLEEGYGGKTDEYRDEATDDKALHIQCFP
jgi:hypothetical protein